MLTLPAKQNQEIDWNQAMKNLDSIATPKAKPESTGNLVTDFVKAPVRGIARLPDVVGSGIETAASGYGKVADLIAGNENAGQGGDIEQALVSGVGKVRDVTTRPFADAVDKALPYSQGTQAAQEQLNKEIADIQSQKDKGVIDRGLESFGAALSNPRGSLPSVLESVPQFLAGSAALKGAGVAAGLEGAGGLAGKVGQTGAIIGIGNAALEGEGAERGARQEMQALSDDKLRENPRFRELEAKYGIDEARRIATEQVGTGAYGTAALTGAAAAALTGGGLEGAMLRGTGGIIPKVSGGIVKEALKGTGKEGLEELSQGYTGQVAQNLAMQPYTGVDWNEGAAEQAGMGAGMGFLSGGVGGATGATYNKFTPKQPETVDTQANQPPTPPVQPEPRPEGTLAGALYDAQQQQTQAQETPVDTNTAPSNNITPESQANIQGSIYGDSGVQPTTYSPATLNLANSIVNNVDSAIQNNAVTDSHTQDILNAAEALDITTQDKDINSVYDELKTKLAKEQTKTINPLTQRSGFKPRPEPKQQPAQPSTDNATNDSQAISAQQATQGTNTDTPAVTSTGIQKQPQEQATVQPTEQNQPTNPFSQLHQKSLDSLKESHSANRKSLDKEIADHNAVFGAMGFPQVSRADLQQTTEQLNPKVNYLDADYEDLPSARSVGLEDSDKKIIHLPKTKGSKGGFVAIDNDYVLSMDGGKYLDLPSLTREQAIELSKTRTDKNGKPVNQFFDVVPRAYAEHLRFKKVADKENLLSQSKSPLTLEQKATTEPDQQTGAEQNPSVFPINATETNAGSALEQAQGNNTENNAPIKPVSKKQSFFNSEEEAKAQAESLSQETSKPHEVVSFGKSGKKWRVQPISTESTQSANEPQAKQDDKSQNEAAQEAEAQQVDNHQAKDAKYISDKLKNPSDDDVTDFDGNTSWIKIDDNNYIAVHHHFFDSRKESYSAFLANHLVLEEDAQDIAEKYNGYAAKSEDGYSVFFDNVDDTARYMSDKLANKVSLTPEKKEGDNFATFSQGQQKNELQQTADIFTRSNRDNENQSTKTALVANENATGRKIQQTVQRLDLPTFENHPDIQSLNFDAETLKNAQEAIEAISKVALDKRQATLEEEAFLSDLEYLATLPENKDRITVEQKNGNTIYTVKDEQGNVISTFTRQKDQIQLNFARTKARDRLRNELVAIGGGNWEVGSLQLAIQPLDTTAVNAMRDEVMDRVEKTTDIAEKLRIAREAHSRASLLESVFNKLKAVFLALFNRLKPENKRAMMNDDKRSYKWRNADNTVMFTVKKGRGDFKVADDADIKGSTDTEKEANLIRKKEILARIDKIEANQLKRGKIKADKGAYRNANGAADREVRVILNDNPVLLALFEQTKNEKPAFDGFEASQISWQIPMVSGQSNPDLSIYRDLKERKRQEAAWANFAKEVEQEEVEETQTKAEPAQPETQASQEAEKPQSLQDLIRAQDLPVVLDHIIESKSSFSGIARVLKNKLPANLKFEVVPELKAIKDDTRDIPAKFSKNNGNPIIQISEKFLTSKDKDLAQFVLHELAHAETVFALEKDKLFRAQLNGIINRIAEHAEQTNGVLTAKDRNGKTFEMFKVSRLFKDAENKIPNAEELVAYGLTDPRFQIALQEIAYDDKTSLWDKFVESIARVLGIPVKGENADKTALAAVLRLSMELVNEQAKSTTSQNQTAEKQSTENAQSNTSEIPNSSEQSNTNNSDQIERFNSYSEDVRNGNMSISELLGNFGIDYDSFYDDYLSNPLDGVQEVSTPYIEAINKMLEYMESHKKTYSNDKIRALVNLKKNFSNPFNTNFYDGKYFESENVLRNKFEKLFNDYSRYGDKAKTEYFAEKNRLRLNETLAIIENYLREKSNNESQEKKQELANNQPIVKETTQTDKSDDEIINEAANEAKAVTEQPQAKPEPTHLLSNGQEGYLVKDELNGDYYVDENGDEWVDYNAIPLEQIRRKVTPEEIENEAYFNSPEFKEWSRNVTDYDAKEEAYLAENGYPRKDISNDKKRIAYREKRDELISLYRRKNPKPQPPKSPYELRQEKAENEAKASSQSNKDTITLNGKEIPITYVFEQLKSRSGSKAMKAELDKHPDKELVKRIIAINNGVGKNAKGVYAPILQALIELNPPDKRESGKQTVFIEKC